MPEFAAFQARFAAAVLGAPDAPDFAAAPQFAVYRNTAPKAAIDALRANYPTVARLLGPGAFDGAALSFFRHFPPSSPILAACGEAFPAFLADSELPEGLDFLSDIARIDRAATECHLAADSAILDVHALAAMAPDQWTEISLAIHPACRFDWFDTGVASLWLALRRTCAVSDPMAAVGSEGIVLTRPNGAVEAHLITHEEYLFLAALRDGLSVGAAAMRVLEANPECDLATLFARLIGDGVFSEIEASGRDA